MKPPLHSTGDASRTGPALGVENIRGSHIGNMLPPRALYRPDAALIRAALGAPRGFTTDSSAVHKLDRCFFAVGGWRSARLLGDRLHVPAGTSTVAASRPEACRVCPGVPAGTPRRAGADFFALRSLFA